LRGGRRKAVGGCNDTERDDAADGGARYGGDTMMPAHVITLGLGAPMDQDVKTWFRQFNYLPPLPLTAARVDTHEGNHTFEHLLTLVAASPHQRFILMAHGHQDGSGLYLKLAPGTSAATEHKFLGRFMELADGAAFNDYDHKKLGMNKAGVQRILDLMQKIRAKRIDCIEFRACNLGRDRLGLDRFRQFFGARLLGAPDLHSFFGQGAAITDRKMLDTHQRGHVGGTAWETYEFPHWLRPRDVKPDLVCCFKLDGENKPRGGHIAADSPARLDAWIKKYVMAGAQQPKGDMALHGLWNLTRQIILEPEDINEPLGGWGGPTDKKLILPLTENYRKHIIYSR
jgi:hypothetical protein